MYKNTNAPFAYIYSFMKNITYIFIRLCLCLNLNFLAVYFSTWWPEWLKKERNNKITLFYIKTHIVLFSIIIDGQYFILTKASLRVFTYIIYMKPFSAFKTWCHHVENYYFKYWTKISKKKKDLSNTRKNTFYSYDIIGMVEVGSV